MGPITLRNDALGMRRVALFLILYAEDHNAQYIVARKVNDFRTSYYGNRHFVIETDWIGFWLN